MRIGLINIRSIRNKLGHVVEVLSEFNLDVLCLTETWLLPTDIDVVRAALLRPFSIVHVPRVSATGGGVAVIHSVAINLKLIEGNSQFSSFELIETKFTCHSETERMCVVYRPGHPGTDRAFMEEFGSVLDGLLAVSGRTLICGDFNYWVDDPSSKPYSTEFLELLEVNNLNNHVSSPTHLLGHTLDLILSPAETSYVKDVVSLPIDSNISDHALLVFDLEMERPRAVKKSITFRSYRNVDLDIISREITSSLVVENVPNPTAENLTVHHNESLALLEEKHFPLMTKQILVKVDSPWYDHSVSSLRKQRRRAERRWRRYRSDLSRSEYVIARRAVVNHIEQCKIRHYREKWASCRGDQKKLFSLVNSLMCGITPISLPSSESDAQLAADFQGFFQSKITRIREELDRTLDLENFQVAPNLRDPPTSFFSEFHPVDESSIRKYIRELNKTHCSLDLINIPKIATAYESAAPFIASLVNQYFVECTFVKSEKLALLRPSFKKAGLDIEDMNSYRPISNLSFLSKIVERAILDQLLPVMEQNAIVSKYQSAYRELHSTETALCRIHNDLLTNVCSGKASLLVLLDLSAAFDTIDHNLLLSDLQSFGVQGDVYLLMPKTPRALSSYH